PRKCFPAVLPLKQTPTPPGSSNLISPSAWVHTLPASGPHGCRPSLPGPGIISTRTSGARHVSWNSERGKDDRTVYRIGLCEGSKRRRQVRTQAECGEEGVTRKARLHSPRS